MNSLPQSLHVNVLSVINIPPKFKDLDLIILSKFMRNYLSKRNLNYLNYFVSFPLFIYNNIVFNIIQLFC
ncbi:hypothetical protein CNEO4_470005 [Clostridium neonatale]|nr:hypothetical protein CNEO4_470005 [Clostridium neonatale]CAI3718187.1 hypothetical protein CNEO4_80136 [Clostridium neonatale]